MTKKVDVISNCLECSWYIPKKMLCGATQRIVTLNGGQGFPDWCPLADLSQPPSNRGMVPGGPAGNRHERQPCHKEKA
jgi:hypothetical protein